MLASLNRSHWAAGGRQDELPRCAMYLGLCSGRQSGWSAAGGRCPRWPALSGSRGTSSSAGRDAVSGVRCRRAIVIVYRWPDRAGRARRTDVGDFGRGGASVAALLAVQQWDQLGSSRRSRRAPSVPPLLAGGRRGSPTGPSAQADRTWCRKPDSRSGHHADTLCRWLVIGRTGPSQGGPERRETRSTGRPAGNRAHFFRLMPGADPESIAGPSPASRWQRERVA
jgi:hypothetical protein